MNEDTFIYETRYLCTGHGRCNILLLCVLTYLFVLSFSPPAFFSLRLLALVPARAYLRYVRRWRRYYAIASTHIISQAPSVFSPFSVISAISQSISAFTHRVISSSKPNHLRARARAGLLPYRQMILVISVRYRNIL